MSLSIQPSSNRISKNQKLLGQYFTKTYLICMQTFQVMYGARVLIRRNLATLNMCVHILVQIVLTAIRRTVPLNSRSVRNYINYLSLFVKFVQLTINCKRFKCRRNYLQCEIYIELIEILMSLYVVVRWLCWTHWK